MFRGRGFIGESLRIVGVILVVGFVLHWAARQFGGPIAGLVRASYGS